jgi:hypothetical protein
MSIKLDEHGFQLVCMKIYSAFWGWVDLDPAKRVNVTLPTGEIERTVMQAVPYIPEVIRAWDTATARSSGRFPHLDFHRDPDGDMVHRPIASAGPVHPAGAPRARRHARRPRAPAR